jgi:hypothetical protein
MSTSRGKVHVPAPPLNREGASTTVSAINVAQPAASHGCATVQAWATCLGYAGVSTADQQCLSRMMRFERVGCYQAFAETASGTYLRLRLHLGLFSAVAGSIQSPQSSRAGPEEDGVG